MQKKCKYLTEEPPCRLEDFDTEAGEWSTQFVAIVKTPRPLLKEFWMNQEQPYYVHRGGVPEGSFTFIRLQERALKGRIHQEDQVSRGRVGLTCTAGELPGLTFKQQPRTGSQEQNLQARILREVQEIKEQLPRTRRAEEQFAEIAKYTKYTWQYLATFFVLTIFGGWLLFMFWVDVL